MSILPLRRGSASTPLHQGLAWLSGVFLEASCLLCGRSSGDHILCPACCADLPPLPWPGCPQCAEPTTHGERCGRCLNTPPHFDACTALFTYAFPIDRLIQALKYGHQLALAPWFGRQLAQAVAEQSYDLAIPLPLHPSRLKDRGFNQSGEILRPLAKELGLATDYRHCHRSRATAPQAELPHDARAKNVRRAFACTRDYTGLRILLVDDVMTTGETLSECARTLKLHGAAHVGAAVVARALRH